MTTSSHSADASPRPGHASAAFERACADAWAPVVRYLRAVAGPDADIEDLAARCIEIAWRRREDMHDIEGFTPWILAIAALVARNGKRGSHRRLRLRARLATLRESTAPHPSAHAELLRGEPGPATHALAMLRKDDREVLVLYAWEELDHAAIGSVLGISRDAAAQRVHRARLRLIGAMQQLDAQASEHAQ